VGATVQTAVTRESLVELVKELTDITGRRPVTDAELAFAKQGIVQGFPSRFETTFGVASQIAVLVDFDLPDDEFAHYQAGIEAVTKADVDRVAREYITPTSMSILIVGDRSLVEGPLKSLPFVQAIERLDSEGNTVAPPAKSKPVAAANASSATRVDAGTN
jgi:zinc protease